MLRHSPQLIEPDKEENAKRRQRHHWRPRRSARPHGGLGRHEGRRLSRDGALDHDRATGQSAATRAAGRWPKKSAAGARNLSERLVPARDLFRFVSATWGWTTPPFALGQG